MSSLADIPPEIDWARINNPPETIDLGEGGGGGRVAFVIPWSYRYNFYDLVAGTDEVFPITGGTMTRKVPLRHPDRPNVFFAVGMVMEGWGGYEGALDDFGHGVMYSHARCIVDFSTLGFTSYEDQPFANISMNQGSEYITKPNTAFKFSDNSYSQQDSGIFVATNLISLTTYLNPTLDVAYLGSMTNKINSTPIFGYPAGHVKFLGCQSQSPVSALGVVTHTKVMNFMYRELHWNYQMRWDGMMDIPINQYTSNPTYASAELNNLLY